MAAENPTNRVDWVDYSKGICIVAVVALYTTQYLPNDTGAVGWMQYWVDFARPFRMPDFFLIAGLFLSRTINVSWPRYLDKKVVHFVYFLALWTTIYFALHEFWNRPVNFYDTTATYLSWYVEPFHMLWFIEMLPIFFVVTRLLKNVPWYYVLTVAALLQMMAVHPELGQINRFCARYVYFYAGYAFAPLVFRLADWAARDLRTSLSALLGWAVVEETLVLAGVSDAPGIGLILGFAGAAAVVVSGRLLSGAKGTSWLRYLGQNSIVVFLSFFVFLSTISKMYDRYGIVSNQGTRQFLAMVISVAGSVLLFRLVRGTSFEFLFRRPQWAKLSAGKGAVKIPAMPEAISNPGT